MADVLAMDIPTNVHIRLDVLEDQPELSDRQLGVWRRESEWRPTQTFRCFVGVLGRRWLRPGDNNGHLLGRRVRLVLGSRLPRWPALGRMPARVLPMESAVGSSDPGEGRDSFPGRWSEHGWRLCAVH